MLEVFIIIIVSLRSNKFDSFIITILYKGRVIKIRDPVVAFFFLGGFGLRFLLFFLPRLNRRLPRLFIFSSYYFPYLSYLTFQFSRFLLTRTSYSLLYQDQFSRLQYIGPSYNLYYQDQFFASRLQDCLLYTSPSPRDGLLSRMPSSA